MKDNKPKDCTRTTIKTDDGNFYLVVSDDFVIGTVPRENDPLMSKTRNIVETICAEITRMMKIRKSSRMGLSSTTDKMDGLEHMQQ